MIYGMDRVTAWIFGILQEGGAADHVPPSKLEEACNAPLLEAAALR